ncbi:hypothetical protein HOM13_01950 [Candidatus Woesearchaeota archaeon]|jgi:hypothetical protein|nr:hypothetical protein [Candidatus Woesearchaeota archaeon]MBT5215476.1 hypothetical protein [Candidatus Woesearchaeota archaeon]MBT6402627.1 hypothetical protein [Candidatus Woesearchaeota archaeon]
MEKPAVTIKAILELMGSPEEHVNKTMDMIIEKLNASKDFEVITSKVSDTTSIEDRPFWSKFVDLELGFKNMDDVTGFCFDFMPSSIEVVEPVSFNFKKDILDNLWNDLIARIHQYDMLLKNMHAENKVMKKKLGINDKPKE